MVSDQNVLSGYPLDATVSGESASTDGEEGVGDAGLWGQSEPIYRQVLENILRVDAERRAAVESGDTRTAAVAQLELDNLWQGFDSHIRVPEGTVRRGAVEELRERITSAGRGDILDLTPYTTAETSQLAPDLYDALQRGARSAGGTPQEWATWHLWSLPRLWEIGNVNIPAAALNLGLGATLGLTGLGVNSVIQSGFNQELADRGNEAAQTRAAMQRQDNNRLNELNRQHVQDLAERGQLAEQARFGSQQQLNEDLFRAQENLGDYTFQTGQAGGARRFGESQELSQAQRALRDQVGANNDTFDTAQGINLTGQPVLPAGTVVPVTENGRALTLQESIDRLRAGSSPEVRGYSEDQLRQLTGAARRGRNIPDNPAPTPTLRPGGAGQQDNQSSLPAPQIVVRDNPGSSEGAGAEDGAGGLALFAPLLGMTLGQGNESSRRNAPQSQNSRVVGPPPADDPVTLAAEMREVMERRSAAQERGESVEQLDAQLHGLERRLTQVYPTTGDRPVREEFINEAASALAGARRDEVVDLTNLTPAERHAVVPELMRARQRGVRVNVPDTGALEAQALGDAFGRNRFRFEQGLLGGAITLGLLTGGGGLVVGHLGREQARQNFEQGQVVADQLATANWDQQLADFYTSWDDRERLFRTGQELAEGNTRLAQNQQVRSFELNRNRTLSTARTAEANAEQQFRQSTGAAVDDFGREIAGISQDRAQQRFGGAVRQVEIDGVRYAVPIFADRGGPGIIQPNLDAPPGQINPAAIDAFVNTNIDLPVVQGIREEIQRQYPNLSPDQREAVVRRQVSERYGAQIQREINAEWQRRRGGGLDTGGLPPAPATQVPTVAPVAPAGPRALRTPPPPPETTPPPQPNLTPPPRTVPTPVPAPPPDVTASPGTQPVGEPERRSDAPTGDGGAAGLTALAGVIGSRGSGAELGTDGTVGGSGGAGSGESPVGQAAGPGVGVTVAPRLPGPDPGLDPNVINRPPRDPPRLARDLVPPRPYDPGVLGGFNEMPVSAPPGHTGSSERTDLEMPNTRFPPERDGDRGGGGTSTVPAAASQEGAGQVAPSWDVGSMLRMFVDGPTATRQRPDGNHDAFFLNGSTAEYRPDGSLVRAGSGEVPERILPPLDPVTGLAVAGVAAVPGLVQALVGAGGSLPLASGVAGLLPLVPPDGPHAVAARPGVEGLAGLVAGSSDQQWYPDCSPALRSMCIEPGSRDPGDPASVGSLRVGPGSVGPGVPGHPNYQRLVELGLAGDQSSPDRPGYGRGAAGIGYVGDGSGTPEDQFRTDVANFATRPNAPLNDYVRRVGEEFERDPVGTVVNGARLFFGR